MGTIGSLSSLYQLSSLLSSGSGSSTSSSSSSSSAVSLETLEQALFSSASGSASGSSNAYLLDLSPEAQSLLNGGSTSTTSGSGTSTEFTLTSSQETAIKNILAKYKDAPFDQATFNSKQDDLQAAGLSPQTLGAEDQIKSFNPTSDLLAALDGNYSALQTPSTSTTSEQTKESNYMQSIVSLWKAQSSTASSGSGTSSSTGISA